jgi:hypothetical protein
MSLRSALVSLAFLLVVSATAKEKDKVVLPADVLKTESVLIVIMPAAGEPLADPTANRKAQEDVEKALMKWGRFRLASESLSADLVIAIRKGTKQAITPVIRGGPVDTRPVIVEPTEGSTRNGAQRGRPPDLTRSGGTGAQDTSPRVGTEVGPSEDTFEVYRGRTEYPLDSSPVWRYMAKDSLSSPAVPAVDEFRKAIAESVKAQAQKQQKKQP